METVTANTLRAIRFERPDHIPMVFWINPACWHHHCPETLFELMADHNLLFPDFDPAQASIPEPAPWERAGTPYTDAWGCLWETTDDGITGAVTQHPLADWNALDDFAPPDPGRTNGVAEIDWTKEAEQAQLAEEAGQYGVAGLEHGHTFLRLSYLRGYENLLFDMVDGDPRLPKLIDMVETFGLGIVQRYLDLSVAMLCYPEDLGMQNGPMLSPPLFRQYIQPVYEPLTAPAREAGWPDRRTGAPDRRRCFASTSNRSTGVWRRRRERPAVSFTCIPMGIFATWRTIFSPAVSMRSISRIGLTASIGSRPV